MSGTERKEFSLFSSCCKVYWKCKNYFFLCTVTPLTTTDHRRDLKEVKNLLDHEYLLSFYYQFCLLSRHSFELIHCLLLLNLCLLIISNCSVALITSACIPLDLTVHPWNDALKSDGCVSKPESFYASRRLRLPRQTQAVPAAAQHHRGRLGLHGGRSHPGKPIYNSKLLDFHLSKAFIGFKVPEDYRKLQTFNF